MNYIDEITGTNLNEEAKQLGKQIGELIKKVKQKIREGRKTRNQLKSSFDQILLP